VNRQHTTGPGSYSNHTPARVVGSDDVAPDQIGPTGPDYSGMSSRNNHAFASFTGRPTSMASRASSKADSPRSCHAKAPPPLSLRLWQSSPKLDIPCARWHGPPRRTPPSHPSVVTIDHSPLWAPRCCKSIELERMAACRPSLVVSVPSIIIRLILTFSFYSSSGKAIVTICQLPFLALGDAPSHKPRQI